MRRVDPNANPQPRRNPKRKMGKPAAGGSGDEDLMGPKPGLESPYPHIAQMYVGKNWDLAVELSRALREPLARRLGVRRRGRA